MAAQSNLRNMVLCLTIVCLVCSAILGVVYSMTLDPIEQANRKALTESIQKVLPQGTISDEKAAELDGQKYVYYECSDNGEVIAYAVKSLTSGFGGTLSLMVGVLADGTIYNASVLSHSETPGLGAKCQTDEAFIAQWQGMSPDKKLEVKKDGGDVDAITAATITSRAYALAVSNARALVASFAAAAEPEQNMEEE